MPNINPRRYYYQRQYLRSQITFTENPISFGNPTATFKQLNICNSAINGEWTNLQRGNMEDRVISFSIVSQAFTPDRNSLNDVRKVSLSFFGQMIAYSSFVITASNYKHVKSMPVDESLETERTTRIYNLAVKIKKMSVQTPLISHRPNDQSMCMQIIAEEPQLTNLNSDLSAEINIFSLKDRQSADLHRTQQKKSIVGCKYFMAHKARLNRLKSLKTRHKLSESHLPLLKASLVMQSRPQIGRLRKEELLQLYDENAVIHQRNLQSNDIKLKLNQTDESVDKKDGVINDIYDHRYRKIKQKYKNYKDAWAKCVTENSRGVIHLGQMNRDLINLHRKKVEKLADCTLRQLKENISPKLWDTHLRTDFTLASIYNQKYTEQIQRSSTMTVTGKSKLVKQLNWLRQMNADEYLPTEEFKQKLQMKRQGPHTSRDASNNSSTISKSVINEFKALRCRNDRKTYDN